MSRVERSSNCGNSPKNRLVEDLAIALAMRDVRAVRRLVTDDAEWRIAGRTSIAKGEALAETLELEKGEQVASIVVSHVATHGRTGAVSGTCRYRDEWTTELCDVFELANAQGTSVSRITSFRVPLEGKRCSWDIEQGREGGVAEQEVTK